MEGFIYFSQLNYAQTSKQRSYYKTVYFSEASHDSVLWVDTDLHSVVESVKSTACHDVKTHIHPVKEPKPEMFSISSAEDMLIVWSDETQSNLVVRLLEPVLLPVNWFLRHV